MSEELQQYLERVRSYRLGHWLYWFPMITPYTFASYGFVCVGPHTAQCHMCGTILSLESVPLVESTPEQQNQLLPRLGKHQPACIYDSRVTPPEDLYRITIKDLYRLMDEILDSTRHTFTKHQLNNTKYPLISYAVWDKYLSKYESVFARLFQNLKFIDSRQVDTKQILTIFGWEKSETENCIECRFCGRKLNTKKYAVSDSDIQRISLDQDKPSAGELFEPVEEHRYFCVWAQAGSEDGDFKKLSGWQICLRHLEDKHLEVEKGWAKKNKFQEVTKVKDQFYRILDSFAARTREAVNRFNAFAEQSKPTLQEKQLEQEFTERMSKHKRELETILGEVEQGVGKPAKKLKAL